VVGRYLAAKVFGSWLAYQGRGLRTVLAGALAALAVLRVEAARQCAANARRLDAPLLKEAIRQSDLILVHLASGDILARKLDFSPIPRISKSPNLPISRSINRSTNHQINK